MTTAIAKLAAAVDGYKAHIVALAFAASAVVAWRCGMLTGVEAFDRAGAGLFGSAARSAIAKVGSCPPAPSARSASGPPTASGTLGSPATP